MKKVPVVQKPFWMKPSDRKKIIKVFGTYYSEHLQTILDTSKIFNSKGEPYSKESIRAFVNGKRYNKRFKVAVMSEVDKLLIK